MDASEFEGLQLESFVEEAAFPSLEGKSQQRVVRKTEGIEARKGQYSLQLSSFEQVVAETELLKRRKVFKIKLLEVSIDQITVLQLEDFDACEVQLGRHILQ